jgi:hypothetical protein
MKEFVILLSFMLIFVPCVSGTPEQETSSTEEVPMTISTKEKIDDAIDIIIQSIRNLIDECIQMV